MASRLIICAGQSNGLGVDGAACAAGGLPIASVPFIRMMGNAGAQSLTDSVATTLRTTSTTPASMGLECQMALDLKAGAWSGDTVCVVKCTQNGTAIATWLPTAAERYIDTIKAACLNMRPSIGRAGFKAYLVWNQGEAERDDPTNAALWASRFAIIHSNLTSFLGVAPRRTIIRLRNGIGTENAVIRAQQASVADDLINRDDTTGDSGAIYGPANVHDMCSAQNTIGSRVATALLAAG